MFVSKKKYKEKLELLDVYRDKCMEKYNEIYKLEMERDNLKGLVDILENRVKMLEDQARESARYRTWKEHLENKEVKDE